MKAVSKLILLVVVFSTVASFASGENESFGVVNSMTQLPNLESARSVEIARRIRAILADADHNGDKSDFRVAIAYLFDKWAGQTMTNSFGEYLPFAGLVIIAAFNPYLHVSAKSILSFDQALALLSLPVINRDDGEKRFLVREFFASVYSTVAKIPVGNLTREPKEIEKVQQQIDSIAEMFQKLTSGALGNISKDFMDAIGTAIVILKEEVAAKKYKSSIKIPEILSKVPAVHSQSFCRRAVYDMNMGVYFSFEN